MGSSIDTNTLGTRGENLVYLRLTSYGQTRGPLFVPAFTGEKCPDFDFLVRLNGASGYFFAQVKTTSRKRRPAATSLKVKVEKSRVQRLRDLPAPTYLLGVDDGTGECFIRAVSAKGDPNISSIPLINILDDGNLVRLYDEVSAFWKNGPTKPATSIFD